jgi:hypothetical protein
MDWSVVVLVALALLAWLWYDSMRARERAVSADGSARRAGLIVMLSGEVESLTMEPFLLQ